MISKLSYYERFSSGSDLWCFFFEPDRDLFKSINWRTNFMIHKMKERTEMTQPLLIESTAFFPNQYLLCLPKTFSVKKSYDLWTQLKHPLIRLFPPLESSKEFLDFWMLEASSYNISYYSEN